MNLTLLAAAALVVVVCAVHSVLGERVLLIPLSKRDDLPQFLGDRDYAKKTLRFVWHVATVFGLGFAALLLLLAAPAAPDRRLLLRVIAVTVGVSGIVALIVSRGRHPSWIAFLVIAALVWFG
jgi:hypothetical protein